MPDLKPAANPTPTERPRVEANPLDAGVDPVTGLHRMSTTAGVGSTEYVAVNVAAVLSLLIGLASVLAFMSVILLVIPLAGLVVAAMSLRQINDSNGTQTGRGLALGGLFLSTAILFFMLTAQVTTSVQARAESGNIENICQQFGQLIHDKKYDQAYDLFSPRFKQRVNAQAFSDQMNRYNASPMLGLVKSTEFNGLVEFQKDQGTGGKTGVTVMKLQWEKADTEDRKAVTFRRVAGKWMIEDIPDMFPSPRKR
jgi:hypothetical protein